LGGVLDICIDDELFVGEKMKDYLQIPPGAPWAVTVFSRVLHEIFFYLESSFTGDSTEICTRRLWKRSIYLSVVLHEGNLEGQLLYCRLRETCKR
jgi:hypothetical protein